MKVFSRAVKKVLIHVEFFPHPMLCPTRHILQTGNSFRFKNCERLLTTENRPLDTDSVDHFDFHHPMMVQDSDLNFLNNFLSSVVACFRWGVFD